MGTIVLKKYYFYFIFLAIRDSEIIRLKAEIDSYKSTPIDIEVPVIDISAQEEEKGEPSTPKKPRRKSVSINSEDLKAKSKKIPNTIKELRQKIEVTGVRMQDLSKKAPKSSAKAYWVKQYKK